MLQIYNKYGQLKVVSSTSSTGVSSVSGVSPITSTGGTNPIISTLVTPNKLLGRHSASTGSMQEIIIGSGLSLVGNTLVSSVTPNALTKVDDTNVTLTLGGTPSTALLQNVSLTLGWTGTLADSRITSASTWNAKQDAISLTTLGTSGPATFISNVLNIPQYTDTYTGTVTSVAALTLGTTGTDLSSSVANSTTTPVITLNVPTASAINRGALSSADWTTFNNKQNALTNPITGTGANGQVAFFNGATTQTGDSSLFWNNTNKRLGIGTNTPSQRLTVFGATTTIPNNSTWVTAGNPISSFYGEGDSGNMDFFIGGASSVGLARPVLIGRKSGGTLASPTSLANGDIIFSFLTSGFSGTQFINTASINMLVDGTVNTSTVPQAITFETGTTSRVERMRINSIGNVAIGANTAGARLDVRAQGALSTDIAFRVRNSADTTNLFQVNGAGGIEINSTTQGFLLPRMTTAQRDAIVSPAIGLQIFNTTAGYLEYFDSFWGWMPIDNSNEWKRRNGTEYFNDFGQNNTFSDGVFQTFASNGGGIISALPNTNNFIGFQGLSTGVLINGANSIRNNLNSGFSLFNFSCGRKSFLSRIWIQDLSTITDRFVVLNGFSNASTSTITNGAAFIYDEGGVGTGTTASANWQIITANGGVRTNFVTSVVVNASTWYSFRIETNANDTEIYYYINDVLVRTETTNIPVAVTNTSLFISITKSTGTTNRGIAVDYLGLKVKLNNAR